MVVVVVGFQMLLQNFYKSIHTLVLGILDTSKYLFYEFCSNKGIVCKSTRKWKQEKIERCE